MATPSISAPSCTTTTAATETVIDTKRKDEIRTRTSSPAAASPTRLRFRLSKLYSAKGLSLKADALRSRAASVDVDDDLVSSSSRGGGGGLDDKDAKLGNSSTSVLRVVSYNKNAMRQLERMDLAFETVKRQLIERMHVLVKSRSFHHWISTIRENGLKIEAAER
ncbi:hypothetical protein Droror1_Dr00016611 [Drosera rotundifolia]